MSMRYVINVILINYSLKRCSKGIQNHDLPVAVFRILFERFDQSAKIIPMNFDEKIENFAKVGKNRNFSKSYILLNVEFENPEIRATRFRNPTKGPGRCPHPKWTVV